MYMCVCWLGSINKLLSHLAGFGHYGCLCVFESIKNSKIMIKIFFKFWKGLKRSKKYTC